MHDVSGSCEHTSYGTSLHSSLLVIVQSCSALQWLQVKNLLDVPPVLEQDCSQLWEQSYTAFLAQSRTSAPQRWRTSPLAVPHTFVVERPCNPLWKGERGCWGKWGSPWNLLAGLLWHQTALLPIHLLTFLPKMVSQHKKGWKTVTLELSGMHHRALQNTPPYKQKGQEMFVKITSARHNIVVGERPGTR